MQNLKNLIYDLTNLDGNCGTEDKVAKYIINSLKEKADSMEVDTIGNVIVKFNGIKKERKKIMLFAHMDEVGFVVKKIEENGFLRLEKLGSINPNILHGLRVEVITKENNIPGVIGTKSHHFLQPEDKGKVKNLSDIYLDIGAFSKEEVLKIGIDVGSTVVFKSDFLELQNNLISNKAMDNRALVAVLLYLGLNIKKEKLENDVYLVFSVQEEFNTRGILSSFRKIEPDFAFGFDITPACDTPDLEYYSNIKVGDGVAITCMNHHSRGTLAGLAPNKRLINFIKEICREKNIKLQNEVATGILTETAYIVFENDKTVVGNFSIPTRYTHTNIEVLSLDDIEACYKLVEELIYTIKSDIKISKKEIIK